MTTTTHYIESIARDIATEYARNRAIGAGLTHEDRCQLFLTASRKVAEGYGIETFPRGVASLASSFVDDYEAGARKLVWRVRMTVKGAHTIKEQTYTTEAEARRRAEKWQRSNSIGSYVASVDQVLSEVK